MSIDLTLEKLDNTLDVVDELINDLPLDVEAKKALCSKIYTLWMDVEEATAAV